MVPSSESTEMFVAEVFFCFSVLSYDLKTVSIYFWTLEDGFKRSDALYTSLLYMEVQKHESAACQ